MIHFITAMLAVLFITPVFASGSGTYLASLRLKSDNNQVLFSSQIRRHVFEFLKRQLNYDSESLKEMMDFITHSQSQSEKGVVTVSLDILTELRKVLETHHEDLLKTRPIHGKNRLKRRIDELVDLIQKLGVSHPEFALDKTVTILDVGAGNGQIISGLKSALKVPTEQVYALELAEYSNRAQDVQWIGYDQNGKIPLEDQSVD